MSPYAFERLYVRLGKPRWFWPAVFLLIVVAWGLAGAVSPDVDGTPMQLAQAEQAEARQQHASASIPPRRKHGSDGSRQ